MPANPRFHSIDILRAITMLLMIFVNDVAGVEGLPGWLGHAHADEDRLGFSDIIFPAFLFIVGLSLPLAISARIKKGDTSTQLAWYIFIRSFALIIMGFFHVNMEVYSGESLLPYGLFLILVTLAFFLIWLDYPRHWTMARRASLQIPGIMLLLVLAIIYRGGEAGEAGVMKPYWWGILGIIGWSYLVAATFYLLFRGSLAAMLILTILALIVNLATHAHILSLTIPIIGDASSLALVLMGICCTLFYLRARSEDRTGRFRLLATLTAMMMIAAGLLLRASTGGISKIHSTPAWVLVCAGITLAGFCGIAWLTDQRQQDRYFNVIRSAGTSTLTAYLLPYFQIGLLSMLHVNYPSQLNTGWPGIIRSIVTAFLIVWITGLLEKRRLRLRV